MKKICSLFFVALFIQKMGAQGNIMLANERLNLLSGYLLSQNGKYKFYNVSKNSIGASKRYWIIKNQTTGEELFESKGISNDKFILGGLASAKLAFADGYKFSEDECIPAKTGILCQRIVTNDLTHVPVPLLCTFYITDQGVLHGPFDMIGNPSAYQNKFGYFGSSLSPTVPVPKDEDVFKKGTNGIYYVPIENQAYALKLLNDGNLVIINNNNQVLWESATGEQQIIDTRLNKKFKDISADFDKGLGLIAQGNIELNNTTISQTKANVVLIAHTYLSLIPGDSTTSLLTKNQNNYIELKPIPGLYEQLNTNHTTINQIKSITEEVPGDFKEKAVLKVIPNPAKGPVHFLIPDAKTSVLYINIIDIHGKTLLRYADTNKADISVLPAGIYYYILKSATETFTGKIIKQ